MEGGVNWMPVIAVLVILYLVVMGIVVASFYCWNKAQTPRQSEKAPLAAAASQAQAIICPPQCRPGPCTPTARLTTPTELKGARELGVRRRLAGRGHQ